MSFYEKADGYQYVVWKFNGEIVCGWERVRHSPNFIRYYFRRRIFGKSGRYFRTGSNEVSRSTNVTELNLVTRSA